ncbi:hypothetical protein [Sinomonas terrae]|uniref:Uncharacterized protein n=1 Tax=Sinomonas terrae TaxID=2908838 RepID=A0ABS9U3T3_9MICC|nr:hypothetical protein [Sinomonas terrae]MCH6471343.1 hypothetical protein [Sinomonas terrae]
MIFLHITREWAEARSATRPRRIYSYVTAASLLAVLTLVTITEVPLWVFWSVVAVDAIADTILVRRWMFQDLLDRASQSDL